MVTTSTSSPTTTVTVAISEREVLKLVLEFLEHNRLHIAQLALERETGLVNGQFTDDVLFLRQLILDGQWDSALDFVEPLKELDGFQARMFRFLITKYKYFELLCIKQEPGPLQDNEFTVEEIVECLRELETVCESGEEFRQLCALLTLPKLSDHEHFRSWNPSSARVECFHAILPIVSGFIDRLNPPREEKPADGGHAEGERLLQLVAKGLLYESAVDYCQAQAMEGKNAPKPKCKFTNLLASRPKLSPADLSLISWLEVLGNEQFTVPFQQKGLDFRMEPLKKPKLEAQWTEQILATPIKPGGQFPYSLVPHVKLKSAQKQLLMSQSMSASMAFEPGFHATRRGRPSSPSYSSSHSRAHSMSQSTFPSISAFSIQKLNAGNGPNGEAERANSLGTDVMRQSQIISDMLSESSAPSTARRSSPASSARGEKQQKQRGGGVEAVQRGKNHPGGVQAVQRGENHPGGVEAVQRGENHPGGVEAVQRSENQHGGGVEAVQDLPMSGVSSSPPFSTSEQFGGAGAARQELEAFCRRNQPQSLPLMNQQRAEKVSNLPPVPELGTPGSSGAVPAPISQHHAELLEEVPQQMVQSRLFQEFQKQQEMAQTQPMLPAHQANMYMAPVSVHQQQQHGQYPYQQQQSYQPVPLQPIAEHFEQHQMELHGHVQQQQHFQQFQPVQAVQQPMVMMRRQQQQQQCSVNGAQQNYVHLQPQQNQPQQRQQPPPFSSRPTSMIIPPGQMMHHSMIMAPGQADVNRPRSFLDQPFPTAPEQIGQSTSSSSYSMMATMPVGMMAQRRGSLGDEEFLEEEGHGDTCGSGSVDEPPNGPAPIRFVQICRYEDAQAIRAVAFHPSGGHFAVGTNSRQLLICRYPDLAAKLGQNALTPPPEVLLTRPKQHRGSVYCAAFSQTGELLATGSNDKTIRLMAVQLDTDKCRIGAELELQHVHDGTVRDLIFMEERLSAGSPSNVLVSGGAGNCQLCVTDCTAGRTFKTFQGHTAPILGLNNWGSSTNFVSCSQDKTIRFWDLRASLATSVIWPTPRTLNSPVTSVCVDPSGKLLISGHEDASIMLYDICGGRVVQLFRPHGDEVRTVRLSNAAYYLLSGSYDRRIAITDMRGNLAEPLAYLPVAEHQEKVIQCRWHPCDFVFLSTSADKSAVLWALPPPQME